MSYKIKILIQHLMPERIISWLANKVATCEITWIKNPLIRWFVDHYQVNMQEAVETNPYNNRNFDSFFVRALNQKARSITNDPSAIVSPADGKILQYGKITSDMAIQAKGKSFDVSLLVGESGKDFIDGNFVTIYLSPKDYHRVHMPFTGRLHKMEVFPGRLFSVQPDVVASVNNVFTRNERVVNFFDTDFGSMAVVLVGAIIVGSIEMQWSGIVVRGGKSVGRTEFDYSGREIEVTKGSEIGKFHLGSTVILLFPKNAVALNVAIGASVKMGEVLGKIS